MSMFKSLSAEAGAEILSAMRSPSYMIPTLVFPIAFYALFGLVLSQGREMTAYLLATYGVFAVMGPAIFGFGVTVAAERERGWLQLKQISPTPALGFVFGKFITTLLFSGIILALLYCTAAYGGIAMPTKVWASLLGVHLLAIFPMLLIGLSIGLLLRSNAALAVANIVFMGLAILGGLWMPVSVYPEAMQNIAKLLPSYHLAEISLAVSQAPGERNILSNLIPVVIVTGLLLGLVMVSWNRQQK